MYEEHVRYLTFDQSYKVAMLLDVLKTDYHKDIPFERLISGSVRLMLLHVREWGPIYYLGIYTGSNKHYEAEMEEESLFI